MKNLKKIWMKILLGEYFSKAPKKFRSTTEWILVPEKIFNEVCASKSLRGF